jgi:hypothetical protein
VLERRDDRWRLHRSVHVEQARRHTTALKDYLGRLVPDAAFDRASLGPCITSARPSPMLDPGVRR